MKKYTLVAAVLGSSLFFCSISSAVTVLFEDFEDGSLDSRIDIQTTGTFNSSPGIKSFTGLDGQQAFGFGLSTNRFSSFENFATNIEINLDQPTPVGCNTKK